MIILLDSLLMILLVLLSIPIAVLFTQVVMSLPKSSETASIAPDRKRPRTAVIVPAHNEADGIAETLANISTYLSADDRLLVVADNCTDNTFQIARDAGAEVVIRNNPRQRGKGYALDFGIRYLADNPPEVVVIVDADCLLQAGTLDRIVRKAAASGRPVQALYMMFKSKTGHFNQVLAEFAWLIKNKVRPLGFHRLGLPCQLMGSGMSFPWSIIVKAELASDHIVEDLKLGIDLAKQGRPPLFCPEGEVISFFPASEEGVSSQRTRWVHGHLGMIASEAPGLLMNGIQQRNLGLIAMALDLFIPPLSLLTLWSTAMVVATLSWSLFVNQNWGGVITAMILFFMLSLSITLCWLRFGKHLIGPGNIPSGLTYVFNKIPLYFKFVTDRQVDWVRSKRDAE